MSYEDSPLREFFYVDVDRVRSLLAQLQGGIVDAIKAETSSKLEGGAEAKVFGIGGRGTYGRGDRTEESRSLQELTFVAFEERANEEGLISELGDEFFDPRAWQRGEVHSLLSEGELVRLTCKVQVLDGGLFRERIGRFQKMGRALVELSPPETTSKMTAKQKAQASEAAIAAIIGNSGQLVAISEFVETFVGDAISLRLLPCGSDHMQFSFSGALLGRREYIQEERESLFSRYGNTSSSWTAVLQIAAIPSQPDETNNPAAEIEKASEEGAMLTPSGEINRAMVDHLAGQLLAQMEYIGIVEGPRWPSVSVTPLGLYRTVPRRAADM
jgi:hypothetical protein